MLDRSSSAACRLNYQSYLWRTQLGFYLHPSIPSLKDGARIADVATGTGAWMLGLAREKTAQVRMDGMDINLAQAPPKQWLPPNINLRAWDIFEDVPEDLVGQFDIVHVRLVLLVVKNKNAACVLENLRRLLKPGGYLQWDELNYFQHRIIAVSPSVRTGAFEELHEFLHGNGKFEWTLTLDKLMMQNGFEDAVMHQYEDSLDNARAVNDLLMATMEEVAAGLARSKREEKANWLRELIRRVNRESLEGAAILVPRIVSVGRKRVGVVQEERHTDGSEINRRFEEAKVNGHMGEAKANGHGGQ